MTEINSGLWVFRVQCVARRRNLSESQPWNAINSPTPIGIFAGSKIGPKSVISFYIVISTNFADPNVDAENYARERQFAFSTHRTILTDRKDYP